MSSSGMPSASLGSGLPPEAPMSPPAQLTRTSTVPSFDSISVFIAATADLSPILPVTAATLPPCRAISLTTAPRSGASPYLAGAVHDMSWIATSAPSSASRSAITRPRPRPDPVTKAILPLSSLDMRLNPGDGKRVAGVVADADAARLLAKGDELLAAEVLVVLDRQRPTFVERARSAVGERRPHIGDQRLPLFAERVAVAAKHGCQAVTYDLGVEKAGRSERALEWAHHQARTDDRRHAELAQPIPKRPEVVIAERPQPRVENLERLGAEFNRDGDEAFETGAFQICAGASRALKSEMIGEAVGVEAERERVSRARLARLRFLPHRSPASTVIDCLVIMRLSSAPRKSAILATSSPRSVVLISWRLTMASAASGVLYQSRF